MKVEIIEYNKDDGVIFRVMPLDYLFDIGIEDHDLTKSGINTLKKYFGDEHTSIAETLKTMMIDIDSAEVYGLPIDDDLIKISPTVTFTYGQEEKQSEKVSHYVDENGKDLIDKWHDEHPIEIFRILMFEQMRKYNTRLGKKDDIKKEVGKIASYANRWLEKETAK